jgi:hypothetical protein
MKARAVRLELSWIARANSSLPVPLSPRSSTVALDGATCCTSSSVCRIGRDPPMIARCRRVSWSCARRTWFSSTRDCWSMARLTARTIWMRLKGLVTKSHAPSFIASTAVSTVPNAVMRMNSVSGDTVFAARKRSSPLMPGIMRSVRHVLTRSRRSRSRAALPSGAVRTSIFSRSKMRTSDSRLARSSSTISRRCGVPSPVIVPPRVAGSAAPAAFEFAKLSNASCQIVIPEPPALRVRPRTVPVNA